METVKLTKYSHGAGCGCKISPKVLTQILETKIDNPVDINLLVGNDSRDDAAVYDMGNNTAIISTTDFFMPIVDDPYMFGKIAAANAISDVYAMGGSPIMAIAILGWPVNVLSPQIAQQVLEGGRDICKQAGISLAGGHSIDSPEPIFGLAVTGTVAIEKLKRNDTATVGCQLFLTKPLGVGVLTTAQKQQKLMDCDQNTAPDSMMKLNNIGERLANVKAVKAMTDVTGFGLLGHLTEMCQGSNLSALINFDKIPLLPNVQNYIDLDCIPGGTYRNWESYGQNVHLNDEKMKKILCDPQTSGGLLIAVEKSGIDEVKNMLKELDIDVEPLGVLCEKKDVLITVK
jgi:selenide,water dikinase